MFSLKTRNASITPMTSETSDSLRTRITRFRLFSTPLSWTKAFVCLKRTAFIRMTLLSPRCLLRLPLADVSGQQLGLCSISIYQLLRFKHFTRQWFSSSRPATFVSCRGPQPSFHYNGPPVCLLFLFLICVSTSYLFILASHLASLLNSFGLPLVMAWFDLVKTWYYGSSTAQVPDKQQVSSFLWNSRRRNKSDDGKIYTQIFLHQKNMLPIAIAKTKKINIYHPKIFERYELVRTEVAIFREHNISKFRQVPHGRVSATLKRTEVTSNRSNVILCWKLQGRFRPVRSQFEKNLRTSLNVAEVVRRQKRIQLHLALIFNGPARASSQSRPSLVSSPGVF